MRYQDGNEAIIGDMIELATGDTATVVFCVDRDEFSDEYPRGDWAYLKSGIMVKTENGTLFHFAMENAELISLIERATE